MNPKVLTAQRLGDGAVVFWGRGGWTERLSEALPFVESESPESEARESEARNEVVALTTIDVSVEDGRVSARRFREQIRSRGPTVRSDLTRH
ncbi:MAG: DUF2849 domain-containing protein [Myxococcota bacterium]